MGLDKEAGSTSREGQSPAARPRNSYPFNVSQLAVSNWTTEDAGSTGISDTLVMNMAQLTHDALCSVDSDIDGSVFTHGTKLLEATALLVDLLVNCGPGGGKPIVGAGAVIAGTGNGGLPNGFEQIEEALGKVLAAKKGLPLVVGTISPYGANTSARSPKRAKADYIHLIQARIMLQLGITSGFSQNRTSELFGGGRGVADESDQTAI
ncbi:hypothetical protein DL768_003328 [Monosporascus sp. mg162]|nr:hypothetical protein DL768_003328 [Monosporascus sp. mg162]